MRASDEDDREDASDASDGDDGDDDLAGRDLYAVLGLRREDAPDARAIKKAYHRTALRLHPDKNVDDPSAASKFQTLQRVYGVLSDEQKRKVYDETGRVDDAELGGEEFQNLYNYYRSVYKEVTTEDIEAFEKTYRGSEEEKKDVLECYERYEGDMTRVFAWVMCSEEAEDGHRFAEVVDAAVKEGAVASYETYEAWRAEVRKRRAPKDPLGARKTKKASNSKKGGDDADLFALIRGKQAMRADQADDMFAALEAKYANPKKKTKKT